MNNNIKKTVEALKENGFEPSYFENSRDAIEALLEEIGEEETVGIGGSMTVAGLGILEKLRSRGTLVFTHNGESDPEVKKVMLKSAMFADVYVTSSNAVTADGKLINIDGTGNRLSSMLFGHKKVIYICGINKLARNQAEAMDRIKKVACRKNTERLNLDTPCRYGECNDCKSKQRICNATLVMEKKMSTSRAIIYIINEELGY